MKNYILIFVSVIISLSVGFFTGRSSGFDAGYRSRDTEQRLKTIGELRTELGKREKGAIDEFVSYDAEITKKDEGGLFKIKYVYYVTGTITNSAAITTLKDIKIRISYLSKTGAQIGAEEKMLHEFIMPGRTFAFKEKVGWPSGTERFQVSLSEIKTE